MTSHLHVNIVDMVATVTMSSTAVMRVFALKLPADYPPPSVLEGLHAAVDAETSERAKRFRLREDELRCLSARLLLFWYLRTILQRNDVIKVERTNEGRPYLVHPRLDMDFNISHDGVFVLLAVTHQKGARVGVDITTVQYAKDARELEEALEDQLHPFEKAALGALPPIRRAEHLATIWALKEAYTKALGIGLGYEFSTLQFRLGRLDDSMWAVATDEKDELKDLRIESVAWDHLITSVGS